MTDAAAVEAVIAEAHRREWARVLAATVRVARDLDLADGADQIFARAAADAGSKLEAIIHGARYRDGRTSRSGPG